MKQIRFTQIILTLFLMIFMLNFSSATTYTGEGTYEVKQGDVVTIGEYSVSVLSIDLDPRDDSWYQYTGQPRVYISRGGVGYVLHKGQSSNVLLNKMSNRYVMSITANEIDVDSGIASISVTEYKYDSDPEATQPDISNDDYTQYGPFNSLGNVQLGDNLMGFVYSDNLKDYYVKINKDEYGPFSSVKDFFISEDNFGFTYSSNSQDYVKINKKEYGPFRRVLSLKSSEKNWAFAYMNLSGKSFIQTNTDLLGPYDDLWSELSLEGDSLGYSYEQRDESWTKEYIKIVNGRQVGSFSGPVSISKKGRYAFCYFEERKGYCNIDGKVYGPYETGMRAIISDKYFIISHQDKLENGGNYYKVINDKKYGPYDYSYHLKVSEDLFAFTYDLGDYSYVNINDNIYGPYDRSGALANLILEENNYAYSYRDDLNWITIVNGEILNCPQGNQVSSLDFHKNNFIFSCNSGRQSPNYVFVPKDSIDLDSGFIQKIINWFKRLFS